MNRQAASLQKQKPLKEKYRGEPGSSRITLEARASQQDTPISCSVDVGRAIYEAGAHAGVGGTGSAACSGDLLLGALAACAQITCQMVAEAMRIGTESVDFTVEEDLDLAGTLGASRDVPVGFETIRTSFEVVAPKAIEEQLGEPAPEDGAILRRVPDARRLSGTPDRVGVMAGAVSFTLVLRCR